MAGRSALYIVCDCCGYGREFRDAEDAFIAGWDGPPDFSGYIACDLCPGALILLGKTERHDAAHQRWIVAGRPERPSA